MPTVAQLLAGRRPRERRVALRWGDDVAEFLFRAISRAELDTLRAKFPPTEDQWTRYREGARVNPFLSPPEFDPVGLAPVLLAATAAEPSMTVAEAELLWASLSDGECARLYEAALAVCMEAPLAPLPASAIGPTDGTGPPSTTQPNTESPSADI
jgi:hypothetical protein